MTQTGPKSGKFHKKAVKTKSRLTQNDMELKRR
jgi:hypothetical protein